MVLRRHKTSRWTSPLAKALLLQSVAVSVSQAAVADDVPPAVSTSQTTPFDNSFTQLGLNEDASQTRGLDLYLDVTLNGASAGLAHFDYREDQLWASVAVLQQLGFIVPPGITDPVPLNSFANIKIDYNARMQSVNIVAPLSTLNLNTTVLNSRDKRRTQASSSPGVLLNYNLYGSRAENNSTNLNAFTEVRAFNSRGVLSSTALTTGNRFSNNSDNNGDSSRDWV